MPERTRNSPTSTEPDTPKRDRHGDRGLPPPAEFDVETLPGSALLSDREVGASLRLSRNTLASWRRQGDHSLRWVVLPNGFVRYRVDAIRAFLALGQPRKRKPPIATKTPTAMEDVTPARRRARRRTRTDAAAAAPTEPR